MTDLTELRFNDNNILLNENLVKGSILPIKISELGRTITIQSNTIIEGSVYAHRIEIQKGKVEVRGAVFTQLELYVNSDATGEIDFMKSVGSADAVVSMANSCQLNFHSDVNGKVVRLNNAFVAGSIYADEITLQNCIVIGGVFATQSLDITNSIVGTFNSPSVKLAQRLFILLPSVFTIEPISALPGTKLYNLSLADLGALFKGQTESEFSGQIEMNFESDELRTVLVNESIQKTIRSYTVIGKVLAVDLMNMEKFQNHFLLTAASLGSQTLKTYDLGLSPSGKPLLLTIKNIRDFFSDILIGKIVIKEMSGDFSISDFTNKFK